MIRHEDLSSSSIRAHLDRVLASAAFRTSKRSQEFIRYVVELKLAGRGDELKERSIGIEVFRRPPSYDPSEDSIVRVNANDVRKRLAQYYTDSNSQIRIELPPGSYVPEFNVSDSARPSPLAPEPHILIRSRRKQVLFLVAVLVVMALFSVALHDWPPQKTALEQFWLPVASSTGTPLILLGPGPAVILPKGKKLFSLADIYQVENIYLTAGDALGAFAIATQLQSMGRVCRLRPETKLSLEEMQSYPVIAIGMFDNPWSTQLDRDVRFICQQHQAPQTVQYCIIDKQQPTRQWRVEGTGRLFPWRVDTDYALITRLIDTTTHQVFVSVGGVTAFGTQAACEFLAMPSYWENLAAQAPHDWSRKNLQIVLEIRVVADTAKPPVVVATQFW